VPIVSAALPGRTWWIVVLVSTFSVNVNTSNSRLREKMRADHRRRFR
jgi:hypothetical protein